MRKKYKPGDMVRVNWNDDPQYLVILEYSGKMMNVYDSYTVFDLETQEVFRRTFMDVRRGTYTKVA